MCFFNSSNARSPASTGLKKVKQRVFGTPKGGMITDGGDINSSLGFIQDSARSKSPKRGEEEDGKAGEDMEGRNGVDTSMLFGVNPNKKSKRGKLKKLLGWSKK